MRAKNLPAGMVKVANANNINKQSPKLLIFLSLQAR
jgi:hypothetical protein